MVQDDYVLIVFLAQYTSWGGAASLYEQHAFLLPVPFVQMEPRAEASPVSSGRLGPLDEQDTD